MTESGLETITVAEPRATDWYQPTGSGGRFWHVNAKARWVWKNPTQYKRWLMVQGLAAGLTKEDREAGARLSPIDETLTHLETERLIDYAGGLAGWHTGVHEINKDRILVTHELELLQQEKPEAGEDGFPEAEDWDAWRERYWPVFGQMLEGLFNGVDHASGDQVPCVQLPRVIDWLWHFMESLYSGGYSTGLALAIAGEPKSGKTLFAQLLQLMCGGITARPYRYMTGQDNFNEEMLQAALLLVDDENSDTHIQSRLRFAAEIKQVVATRGVRIRAMQQKAMLMMPIQRLLILVNLEPERLQVLPPVDNDIRDKLLILKGYQREMPMPTRSPEEQQAFWDTMVRELPYFLYWLTEVHEPDRAKLDRFGPRHWQHPEILEELSRLNPETRTLEFIERMLEAHPRILRDDLNKLSTGDRGRLSDLFPPGKDSIVGYIGTASDVRRVLLSDGDEAPLSTMERREVRAAAYLGRDFVALSRRYPDRFFSSRRAGSGERNWVFLPQTDNEGQNDA